MKEIKVYTNRQLDPNLKDFDCFKYIYRIYFSKEWCQLPYEI